MGRSHHGATAQAEGCPHDPPCPPADSPRHLTARMVATHPEQGWSRLCNGVVVFDDGGQITPDGLITGPSYYSPDPVTPRPV